jgi:hypothetical protein
MERFMFVIRLVPFAALGMFPFVAFPEFGPRITAIALHTARSALNLI